MQVVSHPEAGQELAAGALWFFSCLLVALGFSTLSFRAMHQYNLFN
jgi:hypothetical protein